ncbi:MAG: hypothetical protein ACE5H0_12680 [Bacteroidota bacterium]
MLQNLVNAISERHIENYLSSFVDPKFSTRNFEFIPTQDAQSQYFSVFSDWSLVSEREYFENLRWQTPPSAFSSLIFSDDRFESLRSDSAAYNANYRLIFQHNRSDTPGSIFADQSTIEGLFQTFKFAYTFKDTTVYGQLLDGNFAFVYRDYDQGVDVSWGRDEEMRATYGLFLNAQNLDLIWNNLISFAGDSLKANVVRGFNLTVTFNPSDIIRVDGYVNMVMERPKFQSNWLITR